MRIREGDSLREMHENRRVMAARMRSQRGWEMKKKPGRQLVPRPAPVVTSESEPTPSVPAQAGDASVRGPSSSADQPAQINHRLLAGVAGEPSRGRGYDHGEPVEAGGG